MSRLEKNALEWAVFAVSLVIVLGTLGFLAWDLVQGGDAPPDVSVELGSPRETSGGWAVPVTVANRGDQTAEAVRVEVTLAIGNGAGSGEPERGEIEVAFLPRGSRREGWVTFTRPPAAGRLSARVLGYEQP